MKLHKDMNLNGVNIEIAPIVEENEDAYTLETYSDNIVMKYNKEA